MDRFMTVGEYAVHMRVSPATVRRYIRDGVIPRECVVENGAKGHGRRYRINATRAVAMMQGRTSS